jgi:hypothetical protein
VEKISRYLLFPRPSLKEAGKELADELSRFSEDFWSLLPTVDKFIQQLETMMVHEQV